MYALPHGTLQRAKPTREGGRGVPGSRWRTAPRTSGGAGPTPPRCRSLSRKRHGKRQPQMPVGGFRAVAVQPSPAVERASTKRAMCSRVTGTGELAKSRCTVGNVIGGSKPFAKAMPFESLTPRAGRREILQAGGSRISPGGIGWRRGYGVSRRRRRTIGPLPRPRSAATAASTCFHHSRSAAVG